MHTFSVHSTHVQLGHALVIGILSRVYNRKSVQLPYGFYTRHLDSMTRQSAVNMLSRYLTWSHSRC